MIGALIAFVVTLILVVGIHEAGHFVVARYVGVAVKRVSIGFGRPLFLWRKKDGSEWVWGIWPLGGRVCLLNSRLGPVEPREYPLCFDKQSIRRRVVILLAGSFANLLTAWFALLLAFSIGLSYRPPVLAEVEAASVAAQSGLTSGDSVLAINGESVRTWSDVGMRLIESWGKPKVTLGVQTKTGVLKTLMMDLRVVPRTTPSWTLLGRLGMQPDQQVPYQVQRYTSFAAVLAHSGQVMLSQSYFFIILLKQLLSGSLPFSVLLGPLGFLSLTSASWLQGVAGFAYFIAVLSLAVAFFNLLPIPTLDGGSIIYALVERIRGRPISLALELLMHRLLLIAFALVMVQLILNDLQRLVS